MVEFLQNVLAFYLKQNLVYSNQSLAEEWLFSSFIFVFVLFLIKKQLFCSFVVEEEFHKKYLLKHYESFQTLVFKGSLSIEIA